MMAEWAVPCAKAWGVLNRSPDEIAPQPHGVFERLTVAQQGRNCR